MNVLFSAHFSNLAYSGVKRARAAAGDMKRQKAKRPANRRTLIAYARRTLMPKFFQSISL